MTRKLFSFAKQECMEENPDSLMFQEVLTPGQLYLMFLKVRSPLSSVHMSFFHTHVNAPFINATIQMFGVGEIFKMLLTMLKAAFIWSRNILYSCDA